MERPAFLSRLMIVAMGALGAIAAVGCSANAADDETEEGVQDLTADEQSFAKIRAAVKDVNEEHVVFAPGVTAPKDDASSGAQATNASLYGVDWFQKWGGGKSADHTWTNGSEYGQRCMWASVARFEAIMKDAPPELAEFLTTYKKWDGSFYNWNDDYAGKSDDGEPAVGDAKGARLWAWRTHLSKWVSATAKDGSCYLPTRQMLVDFVKACKTHAEANGGEMQNCEQK